MSKEGFFFCSPNLVIDIHLDCAAGLHTLQQDAGDDSESHEAVENLLESYFMQIDSQYDRLEAIGEYVEDTEE